MSSEYISQNTGGVRFPLRKSNLCLTLLGVGILLLGLTAIHAYLQQGADLPGIDRMAETVRNWELTDLCLFTEARYTRHPSQADLHSAFQDHPVSLEHFPSGSLVGPPARLRRFNGTLD